MPSLQLFDQLLQFPLFQGMSRDDLAHVAGHARLDFVKYAAGKTVYHVGDASTHLCFLLSGTLEAVSVSDDESYFVSEELLAPYLLQPEAIVGYHQCYTATFSTLTAANFMLIDKQEVMRLCSMLLVFRLNLLNIFATQTQKLNRQHWRSYPATLDIRIARFFESHCLSPSGHKDFHILMKQLALEVGDSRLDVSRALNRMESLGLLRLYRGRIEIPRLEQLTSFCD